jgi:hypothetical protein
MTLFRLAAAAALAVGAMPIAANAQTAAGTAVVAGATVYGPQGDEVGKIDKVVAGNAVLNTGNHAVTIPVASFAKNSKGLLIGATKAQIDAAGEAAEQQAAQRLAAALVPGAAVHTTDNVAVGTIKSVEADGSVVVDRPGGNPFALKKDAFAIDANGAVMVGYSDATLKSILAASAPAPAATASAAAATSSDGTGQ